MTQKKLESLAKKVNSMMDKENAHLQAQIVVEPEGLFTKLVFRFVKMKIQSRIIVTPK